MRTITWLAGMLLTMPVMAMEPMADTDLQAVDGQAGADLSLELRLNHDASDNFFCVNNDLQYCRLAIGPNNRYDDGSYIDYSSGSPVAREANGSSAGATLGKKLWLVFKGIQGTINIQYAGLDGVDLPGISKTKAGLALTYDAARPILIRNFGYNALSVETDTVDNEGTGNVPGYLKTATYSTAGFDNGRETGFTGMMMNGNLAFSGVVKIFSCTSGARC